MRRVQDINEDQKTYIELQTEFCAIQENLNSVRALYDFKEKLEQSEDRQAKEVLVDVYNLLEFKKAPMTCSAKSEITPIKRPSSGWVH